MMMSIIISSISISISTTITITITISVPTPPSRGEVSYRLCSFPCIGSCRSVWRRGRARRRACQLTPFCGCVT
jgi:hypothetical protein